MNSNEESSESLRKLFIGIVVVIVFFTLMTWLIIYSINSEPNAHSMIMRGFSKQFQQSVTNAHWQWQAEGRPERIMLLHFDNDGKEVGRMPVRMNHLGQPWLSTTSDGCGKLWFSLLNVPPRVDGFKVISEYFAPEQGIDENNRGHCRYRIAYGVYFDYDLDNGNVVFKDDK